jgi:hypothetical protein
MHTIKPIVYALFALACQFPSIALSAQLWFAPGDDLNVRGVVTQPDFMRLFSIDAPWQTGMSKIDVIQFRSPWLIRRDMREVRQVTTFIEQKKIKLAVPLGMVSSDTCGKGIEGMDTARQHEVYPREMKKRGIPLDYIVMDEPLFFGHDYSGRNACHFSIPQLADTVADNVKMIRSYYPNIQFVLSEPIQSLQGGPDELKSFLAAYKARLGELPLTVRFDIAWNQSDKWHRDWHQDVPRFIQMLNSEHIGYSIIFDAGRVNGRPARTDAAWVASAKANVDDWATLVRQKPVEIVIQTWDPYPSHILPEDDSSTMTGFLKWFIERSQGIPSLRLSR